MPSKPFDHKANLKALIQFGLESLNVDQLIHKQIKIRKHSLLIAGNVHQATKTKRLFIWGIGKGCVNLVLKTYDHLEEFCVNHAISLSAQINAPYSLATIDSKRRLPSNIRYFDCKTQQVNLPTQATIQATRTLIETLSATGNSDIVIGIITGGGSATLALPIPGLSLSEKLRRIRKAQKQGYSIHKLNAMRSKLSQVKGGKLANFIKSKYSYNFIISDVVGDDIATISSGPTAFPKGKIHNKIIASNMDVLNTIASKAKALGYTPLILSDTFEGESRELGRFLADVSYTQSKIHSGKNPLCVIAGGETTTTLTKSSGKGGRNQEIVLSTLLRFKELGFSNAYFASIGSDGEDGPTDAAGGMLTPAIIKSNKHSTIKLGSLLDTHNSYKALEQLNALVKTGPTGVNVRDFYLSII